MSNTDPYTGEIQPPRPEIDPAVEPATFIEPGSLTMDGEMQSDELLH